MPNLSNRISLDGLPKYLRPVFESFETYLFIITFIIRIGYAYYIDSKYGTSKWIDDFQYLAYANSISKQGLFVPDLNELNKETCLNSDNIPVGSGSSIVGPVLPTIIFLLLKLFGGDYHIIYFFNAFLGALTVLLLINFGKRFFTKSFGIAMGIWFAINPDFIRYTPHLLKEPLLLFLVFLQFYMTIRLLNDYSAKKIIYLAIISFVLVHLDERYFVISVLLGVVILIYDKSSRFLKRFTKSLLYISIFIVFLIPWTIRNYNAYGEFVLLTERTIPLTSKIIKSSNTKTWDIKQDDLLNPSNVYDMEAVTDSIIKGLEVTSIPGYYVENIRNSVQLGKIPRKLNVIEKSLNNLRYLFTPFIFRGIHIYDGYFYGKWSLSHNITSILFYGIFIPFFIIGVIISLIHKNKIGILVFYYVIILAIIHLVTFSVPRYRTPVDPIILVGAIIGISWLLNVIKNNSYNISLSNIGKRNHI
jgi:hypothetical protein